MGENKSDTDFEEWLNDFVEDFKNLPDSKRNLTLQKLIDSSGSSQLCYLQSQIDILFYRDFLRFLPRVVIDYLLTYLDPETLLNCCRVSKLWNDIISNDTTIWHKACRRLELDVPWDKNTQPPQKWKKTFVDMRNILHRTMNLRAFKSTRYLGHTVRATAVSYWNKKVATGSDDHIIRIWDSESDKCISVIPTDCTISGIKFNDNVLILGSYCGYLKSFCWKSSTLLQTFHQHTSAVFCLDFNHEFDILVSGSADDTIRIWSIEKGVLWSTLRGHEHWVINLSLTKMKSDENEDYCSLLLLTMDRREIRVWPITIASDSTILHPIKCVQRIQTFITNSNFVTPGFQCQGEFIYFIKQDPETSTYFCCWNMIDRKMEYERQLDCKVKNLLGVGRKYFCVVTPSPESRSCPNFLVFSIKHLKPVIKWSAPTSRATTPGHSQMTLGEQNWLDGLNENKIHGIVFASGLDDCSFYILKWNHDQKISVSTDTFFYCFL